MSKRVFAVVAHPDDVEFAMAGTLILLGRAGYELHVMTIANGSCGSVEHDAETIAAIRTQESETRSQPVAALYERRIGGHRPPLQPGEAGHSEFDIRHG